MQNRYVGDVGDYVKLSILRGLSGERRIGIAWWLFPDESHNRDGRHLGYLDQDKQWRAYDPPLFDALLAIRKEKRRDIRSLEQFLENADPKPLLLRTLYRLIFYLSAVDLRGGDIGLI